MDDAAAQYEAHAAELVRFAAVVGTPSSADDIVSTVTMRVLLERDDWRHVDNLRAYLYRSVVNEVRDRTRGRQRRERRELALATGSPSTSPDAFVRPEVLDAVARLTPRQRAVIYFTYWLDHSVDGVADQLDVSRRTVERELTTARSRLEVLLR